MSATVQIVSPTAPTTIRDPGRVFVEVKQSWAGTWEIHPYLYPVECEDAAAPTIPRATFEWRYGSVKQADVAAFADFKPKDLRDQYVRTRIARGTVVSTRWTGIFAGDSFALRGPDANNDARGVQTMTAYGLEHLLDREPISDARCDSGGSVVTIGWLPAFNADGMFGGSVRGNRTSSVTAHNVHAFSTDGAIWTHLDIAQYLLAYHAPAAHGWAISGQYDQLANLTESVDVEGLTLRQALDAIIPRRRGLGWCVRVIPGPSGGEIAVVHIFTVIGTALSTGSLTVAANAEQASWDLGSAINLEDVVTVLSEASRYDSVEAVGERMQTCFSLSAADETLEGAWTAAEEYTYKSALGLSETPERNDNERRTDRFARVFTTYRPPQDWDWTAGNGTGAGPMKQVAPAIKDDGTLDTATAAARWPGPRAFLRHLPIRKTSAATGADPEYLEPLAIIGHLDDGYFYQLDAVEGEDMSRCSVRMCDREMAAQVRGRVNHVLARNHWIAEAVTNVQPQYDWEMMILTVACETDVRARAVAACPTALQSGLGRTLRVFVPNAHMWYVVPGTVTGVEEGALVHNNTGGLERDDSGALRAVAAFALAWHGVPRASVRLRARASLNPPGRPGEYVVDVVSGLQRTSVGTVVTRRRTDFRTSDTEVQTSFSELDFTRMAGVGSGAAMNKTNAHLGALSARVGNLPVRAPATPRVDRQVAVKNDSGEEIPAHSFAEVTGLDSGVFEVGKPSADSIAAAQLVITGLTAIPSGYRGTAWMAEAGKLPVAYSGTAPSAGDDVGTVSGQWYASTGKTGFKSNGSDASLGVTQVSPFRALSSDVMYNVDMEATTGGSVSISVTHEDGVAITDYSSWYDLINPDGNALTIPVVSDPINLSFYETSTRKQRMNVEWEWRSNGHTSGGNYVWLRNAFSFRRMDFVSSGSATKVRFKFYISGLGTDYTAVHFELGDGANVFARQLLLSDVGAPNGIQHGDQFEFSAGYTAPV